jgi:hypothetical protein
LRIVVSDLVVGFSIGLVDGLMNIVFGFLNAFFELGNALAQAAGDFGESATENEDSDDKDNNPLRPAGQSHESLHRVYHAIKPFLSRYTGLNKHSTGNDLERQIEKV